MTSAGTKERIDGHSFAGCGRLAGGVAPPSGSALRGRRPCSLAACAAPARPSAPPAVVVRCRIERRCDLAQRVTHDAAASAAPSGTVHLYTSVTQNTIDAVVTAYEAVHPEVTVDVFRAPTGELAARIAAEQRAGRSAATSSG